MSHNIKHTKKYTEHIESLRWGLFRAMVIEDRKCCEVCGSTKKLHVHHRHYDNLGEERDEDVTLLCSNHHMKLHSIAMSRHMVYDEAYQVMLARFLKKSKRVAVRKRSLRVIGIKIETKKQKYAKIRTMKQMGEERAKEHASAKALRAKRLELWGV